MNARRILSGLATLLVIFVSLSGCKEDSPASGSRSTVTGIVINTTAVGVRGATVNLFRTGQTSPVATATTNENGQYELRDVENGSFELRISAEGYLALSQTLTISGAQTRTDTLRGAANVIGQILNSQTGSGLDSAEVSFSFGNDTARASAALRVITDSQGRFALRDAPTGTFTCVVRRRGYFTQVVRDVRFNEGQNQLPPTTIVPPPAPGSFRIVLTWGQTPNDLDSHLTGPDSAGGRFHCFYGNMNPPGSNASLDVDDTSAFGPETITIRAFRDGMYRYSVHNYSNQSSTGAQGIFASPARVEVYNEQGLLRTYAPPQPTANGGNTWRVFEINVQGGTRSITDVNVYVTASSSGDIGSFRPVPKAATRVLVE